MLYGLLDHYGGRLPEDTVVVFNNTGKERGETLEFVHRCEVEWDVPIVWLEYHRAEERPLNRHKVVDYERASRNGEPFETLIDVKNMLPSPVRRFCTQFLKIHPSDWYLRRELGWPKRYLSLLGMRADEPRRIRSSLMSECLVDYPLYHDGQTRASIRRFWREMPFDLGIEDLFGNCDLCFMKGTKKLAHIIREDPGAADWWIAQEARKNKGYYSFRDGGKVYKALTESALAQGALFAEEDIPDHLSWDDGGCFCGDW